MKFIRKSSEDEMIAVFLKAEILSPRFRNEINSILSRLEINNDIITSPNINDDNENTLRTTILNEYRGYSKKEDFFEGFPESIEWSWYCFTKEDMQNVRYINYDYWNELSNNTRLPLHAAKSIRDGIEVFGVSNKGFLELSKEITEGVILEPIILIKAYEKDYYTVVEGHARLTAYALNNFTSINSLKVVVGHTSYTELKHWGLY